MSYGGLARTFRLARAFRAEQSDPDFFYTTQAADTVDQVREYTPVEGRLVLDVGGGAGYFTKAFADAGARAVLIEPGAGAEVQVDVQKDLQNEDEQRRRHAEAVKAGRLAKEASIAGDGYHLPVKSNAADLVLSSNVLEHVPDPEGLLDELVRVTRPGGLIYVSFTTWYSPWGGHETAPWHFLGGERAARRYERRHGQPPGNRFGESLFACHAGTVLRHLRRRTDVDVIDALPRYHPRWLHWLVVVPGIREFAVWNLLVVLRKGSHFSTP